MENGRCALRRKGNCGLHLLRCYHNLRYATAAYYSRASAVITLHFIGITVYDLKIIAPITYDLELLLSDPTI